MIMHANPQWVIECQLKILDFKRNLQCSLLNQTTLLRDGTYGLEIISTPKGAMYLTGMTCSVHAIHTY